jgi:hypothetical protein
MVAIREYTTVHAHGAMNRMSHAVPERLHAERKRAFVVGLDDEVQVVRLH